MSNPKGRTIHHEATPISPARKTRDGITPGGRKYTARQTEGSHRATIQVTDSKKIYQKGGGYNKASAKLGDQMNVKTIRKGPTKPVKK